MRVLLAPDKFRGSATAPELCAAMADAVSAAGGTPIVRPMADGGEGTLDALGGGNRHTIVTGPSGVPVEAAWRLDGDDAVIEVARACGLGLAGGPDGNDAVAARTTGVGELILAATAAGARHIVLGLGGSATTDGGAGALDALATPGGRPVLPAQVTVCCDTRTRFTDAARVFGPQKGAGPDDVERLGVRLARHREQLLADTGVDVDEIAGSGAAGGLAGGLAAYGAQLVVGFDEIARRVGFEELLDGADLVITGEGRLDVTSLHGKVVGEVIARARARGMAVLVVAGDAAADVRLPDGVALRTLVETFGRAVAFEDAPAGVRRLVSDYLEHHPTGE